MHYINNYKIKSLRFLRTEFFRKCKPLESCEKEQINLILTWKTFTGVFEKILCDKYNKNIIYKFINYLNFGFNRVLSFIADSLGSSLSILVRTMNLPHKNCTFDDWCVNQRMICHQSFSAAQVLE